MNSILDFSIYDATLTNHLSKEESSILARNIDRDLLVPGYSFLIIIDLENITLTELYKFLYMVHLHRNENHYNIQVLIDKSSGRINLEEYQLTESMRILESMVIEFNISPEDIRIIDLDNYYDRISRKDIYSKLANSEYSGYTHGCVNSALIVSIMINYDIIDHVDCIIISSTEFDLYSTIFENIRKKLKHNTPQILVLPEVKPLDLALLSENNIKSTLKRSKILGSDLIKLDRLILQVFLKLVNNNKLINLREAFTQELIAIEPNEDVSYKLRINYLAESIEILFQYLSESLNLSNKPDVIDLPGTREIFDALRHELRYSLFKIILSEPKEVEYSDLVKKINEIKGFSELDPSTISKAVKKLEDAKLIGTRSDGPRKKYLRALAKSYNFSV
ncbi:MAG: winged helix-turn-helix transcriptional regulator [Candidatus Heimdallarchaeota archaeon]|nr:winged helix-turn-helix transcriptional regulator [Candidatus Heimdallarchaeota archaeon]